MAVCDLMVGVIAPLQGGGTLALLSPFVLDYLGVKINRVSEWKDLTNPNKSPHNHRRLAGNNNS